MDSFGFFIYSFTSVFTIVNPFGGLMSFMSLTEGMDSNERRRVADRAVATACLLALIFAFTGELILRFFQITVDNLRVAGGALLFLVALDMLHARHSRGSMTPEELTEAGERDDISVFPLATPLLTGPGAITAVIVGTRMAIDVEQKLLAIGAILLTFVLTHVVFRYADRLYAFLGLTVTLVITRIMGLLLGAIAVNYMATGLWNIYRAMSR